jgi:2-polyprenyl-3-methyl-5-hydroxy-6-metoxy-1,4-benzoquinol methylase
VNTAHTEWSDLAFESQNVWNTNAEFWDSKQGDDGNHWHLNLIRPGVKRLLNGQPGQHLLDIACGNGIFSRHMADLGLHVTAFDFSASMIDHAKARSAAYTDRIAYHVIDATNAEQLRTLGDHTFDAAVANMALMDIADIDPLLQTLSQLLKHRGVFVFAISHPCFQSPNMVKIVEEMDHEGHMEIRHAVKIYAYKTSKMHKGLAIVGQPVSQHYFHRPLSLLLQKCFDAGFAVTGLEEPTFDAPAQNRRSLAADNYSEIPFALIVRLQVLL